MNHLTLLLKLAGIMHIGLACAGMLMPRVVNLRFHITSLPPFIRNLFWVYYTFIAMCLVSFGVFTFVFADKLAAGDTIARAVCIFLAIFWSVRLIAASFIFDVKPYLTSALLRLGYHATNVVFVYLVAIYAFTVWKGGAL